MLDLPDWLKYCQRSLWLSTEDRLTLSLVPRPFFATWEIFPVWRKWSGKETSCNPLYLSWVLFVDHFWNLVFDLECSISVWRVQRSCYSKSATCMHFDDILFQSNHCSITKFSCTSHSGICHRWMPKSLWFTKSSHMQPSWPSCNIIHMALPCIHCCEWL